MNLVGRAVDRYDVGEQLGQGGFGAVYRARHRVLGTYVALKVLWPDRADDPKNVERFLQEARAAAAIGSPHIVVVSDAGRTDDGVVYLAMELLEGRDLAQELRARSSLPIGEAVTIVLEILEGLTAAHEAGIIHRDLKPGNVFLVKESSGRRAKLLDFGISKVIGARTLTAAGVVLGTPQYMAPEQLEGSRALDHRADLFAVGCILYQLITSEVPFVGATYQVILARVQGMRPADIRSKAPVPDALADVIMRALALDPDARWPNARAMSAALRSASTQRPERIRSAPSLRTAVLVSEAPPSLATAPVSEASLSEAALSEAASSGAASSGPARPKAWPMVGLAALAILLAGALGVLGVLGYRLYARPSPGPTISGEPAPVRPSPVGSSAPRLVPVVVPVPTARTPEPEPVPRAPGPAPRVRYENYAGGAPRREFEALLERATPELRRCAQDRPLHLVVQAMVNPMSQMVMPHPTRRSDDRRAAECAADVIREAGPPAFDEVQSAAADVVIDLAANR